ncbi:hypothetical protein Cni_G05299 [Canna indica]|uniref:RRM domain-containing protein n=1 Tax=Canna indica TaxID=4628 RepID=A0AAQ3Q5A4_9LILI|nr:hypothetical protein Cni_G05299 [Canna indica]
MAMASKALSMAEGLRLPSFPTTIFAPKSSLALGASVPFPRLRLHRPSSSFLSSKKTPPLVPLVAQTSEWARQEEEEVRAEDEQLEGEDLGDWQGEEDEDEAATADGAEGGLSKWESEGGDFVKGNHEMYPETSEELLQKLFVGNLPYDMDSEALAHLFEKAGTVEIAEVIYNRETEQSRGFGFVTMSTVEETEKAIDMFHHYDINGRLLTVNKAAPRGARVERTPRNFEPSFRIYVGNLPWQVDDARLEQVFSEHGKVVNANVVYDRESGRSRGFGFVRMASQTEMDDAIAALDGQNLDGRTMRVNVAEERPRRASF